MKTNKKTRRIDINDSSAGTSRLQQHRSISVRVARQPAATHQSVGKVVTAPADCETNKE